MVIRGIELAEKISKGRPDQQAWRSHGNHAGNLGGRPGCVSRLLTIDEANTTDSRPSPKFALDPPCSPAHMVQYLLLMVVEAPVHPSRHNPET